MQSTFSDLQSGETVLFESKVSKAKQLLKWLSAPSFIILPSFYTLISKVNNIINKKKLMKQMLDEVGEIPEAITEGVSVLTLVLIGLGIVALSILLLSWCVFCWITTTREKNAFLVFTDLRVIGKNLNQHFVCNLEDVVDVFSEKSLFGKIFHYGDVTIHAKNDSITVKGIKNPDWFKNYFRQLVNKPI